MKTKTFNKDQKVTHVEHGNGIVKRLRNNDTEGWIDFGGQGQWFHATDKSIQRGVNTYVEKNESITIEELKEKIAMVKGEYCTGSNSHAEGGRIVLERLKQMLNINDLENILQGKK